MKLRIIASGPLTTVQDMGREGYMNVGFSGNGAMDSYSMRLANILVGNDEGEGALEMTFMGISAEFDCDAVIAVTGADMSPELNGNPIENYRAVSVHCGDVLRMKTAVSGMRAYLAVAGGFDIERKMGSLSTNLKCKLGGFMGRKLAVGDELPLKRSTRLISDRTVDSGKSFSERITVRVILGPQNDYFTDSGIKTFLSKEYTVSEKSDRMGVRLCGERIENKNGVDIISDGIAMGSVQIPASGEPIIMMADRQTTGGYAKIATVISADLMLIAQARAGTKVSFKLVKERKAVSILKKQNNELYRLKCKLNSSK